jgi:hypothetical protein
MPWKIKGQSAEKYRPSTGRLSSNLSPVNETREKAMARWNKLRQSVMRQTAARKARRISPVPPGWTRKGRFLVKLSPPKPKLSTPGKYGRFTVVKNSSPKNNFRKQYSILQTKIIDLEEKILQMKREFARKIDPLEDKLDEYYEKSKNLKKRIG